MRTRRPRALPIVVALLATASPIASHGQTSASMLETVQVTATRFGERVQEVPGSIGVVTGEELRDRGATDLRSALALLGGVTVATGGDEGPAGSVPGLLGVREVDDLLLLIDGIPAGGAFIPQFAAISLTNVERIEVLRGATPVYFGTTAFAGTINVIHYAAGQAENAVSVRYGSYGSVGASGSTVLSTGVLRQSLAVELGDDKLSDPRAGYKRAQGSYRLGTEIAGGQFRADVNLLTLRQKPTSPGVIDPTTGHFTSLLPVDFNQNPANAKLDTDRSQLVLGYDRPFTFGQWGTTLAYTDTKTDSVRAFVDVGDTPGPYTSATRADVEAFTQSLHLHELFVDSHLTAGLAPGLNVTAGINLLTGRADADSVRYGNRLLLNGQASVPAIDGLGASKGTLAFEDYRRFIGGYLQGRYAPTVDTSLLAGVRWNSTHETRAETRVNSRGVVTPAQTTQDIDRLSGSVGGQWRALKAKDQFLSELSLHASVGNTFQPAQIAFGPNPEAKPAGGGLLKPETQRSLVVGFKGDILNELAEFDLDGFFVDFDNQPVLATRGGTSVLESGGRQRYKGVEFETAVHPVRDWTVKAHATWADARYRDYVTDLDGTPTQLAGKRQILNSRLRAGAGIIYAPERGLRGSLTAIYTGSRYLDAGNTARVGGYSVIDASLGYRYERFTLTLTAANLGDRRDAILLSELGEGQFYRMSGRRIDAVLSMRLR